MANTFFEVNKLLNTSFPDSEASAVNSGWLDAGDYFEIVALLLVGDMVATATLNTTVEQATAAAGTGAKPLLDRDGNSLSITELTAAGGDGDDPIGMTINPDYFDVEDGFNFFRITVTPAVAAVEMALVVLGAQPRMKPIRDYVSDWTEIVGP